jgi:methyl-accepting chemotaxis protein
MPFWHEWRSYKPVSGLPRQASGGLSSQKRLIIEPAQVERLKGLRPPLQAKLDELAQTVELRRQGFEAALAVVRTDVGQRLMEEIDTRFEEFRTAENALLDARTLSLEENLQRTTGITGFAGLLATISAVIGAISLARNRAQV